jgi:sulfatase maturation enzyme AslB (radical SAM superfamily)
MQDKKIFQKRILHIKDNACEGCKWWDYCKGGCPYESKGQFNNYFDKSHWCESYKMLFNYIDQSSKIAQNRYIKVKEVV